MRVAELAPQALESRLRGQGLGLQTGTFSVCIRSRIASVGTGVAQLYADFPLQDTAFADFHVELGRPAGVRRWLKPQVDFLFDGERPFKPLPLNQAYPMLEWGLNWCVSMHAHHYLVIHAAVVEKNGFAAILPAPPGSGKSTLCAGLVLSGWRLLSDELTLIDRVSGLIHPLPRPVSLKNQSIDIIRGFSPGVFINRESRDTSKGTVAHMRPPRDSVLRQHVPAQPGWVIFPEWRPAAATELVPRSRAQTFIYLAQNAFNYSHLGEHGFALGTQTVEQCDCHDFTYSDLSEAVQLFDCLAARRRRANP
ncbi:MAG: HprK-related kinase A [Thiobacillaceae bacterium]